MRGRRSSRKPPKKGRIKTFSFSHKTKRGRTQQLRSTSFLILLFLYLHFFQTEIQLLRFDYFFRPESKARNHNFRPASPSDTPPGQHTFQLLKSILIPYVPYTHGPFPKRICPTFPVSFCPKERNPPCKKGDFSRSTFIIILCLKILLHGRFAGF